MPNIPYGHPNEDIHFFQPDVIAACAKAFNFSEETCLTLVDIGGDPDDVLEIVQKNCTGTDPNGNFIFTEILFQLLKYENVATQVEERDFILWYKITFLTLIGSEQFS